MTVHDAAETAGFRAGRQARRSDPLARLSDHQWYYQQARQTVFFALYSQQAPDTASLIELAENLVASSPQIADFYEDLNGHPLRSETLSHLVDFQEVDALDPYPDAWDMSGTEMFARHDLPMLRIRAAVLRGGPDAQGRRAIISVLSAHALLEGADSALLSRSQAAGHGGLAEPLQKRPLPMRVGHRVAAVLLCPIQLITGIIRAPGNVNSSYRSLVVDRSRLRRLATRFGVRQRTLMFALVAHAVFSGRTRRRRLPVLISQIETKRTTGLEGEFFRHWILMADFTMDSDFATFVRGVDAEISRVEKKDKRASQSLLNALFAIHRRLQRWLPFLYPDRYFRSSGGRDLALSITPPHRLHGALARGMMEPIHAGSFHPGFNTCVFVPAKQNVTFNFTMRREHIGQIGALAQLLDKLDGQDQTAIET